MAQWQVDSGQDLIKASKIGSSLVNFDSKWSNFGYFGRELVGLNFGHFGHFDQNWP